MFIFHKIAWPSGLRRWFKAPVFSKARVRIPPLSNFLYSTFVFIKYLICILDIFFNIILLMYYKVTHILYYDDIIYNDFIIIVQYYNNYV